MVIESWSTRITLEQIETGSIWQPPADTLVAQSFKWTAVAHEATVVELKDGAVSDRDFRPLVPGQYLGDTWCDFRWCQIDIYIYIYVYM